MILDSVDELKQLSSYDEWLLHPIYLDDKFHPVENRISCLYITNIIQWDSYIIPIEHTEKVGDIQLSDVFDYFAEDDVNLYIYDKKSALNHINDNGNIFDLQLLYFLNNDEWEFHSLFDDYYRMWDKFTKINTMIPLSILYDRMDEFYQSRENEFTKLTKYRDIKSKKPYKNYDQVIHTLQEIERNGLCKDGDIVYTQYYIYTSTGRPSNRFGGTNYAALNKSDDTRTHYVSRFDNGRLYLYDYQAFHPTIISNYLKIARPPQISMHEWLGRKYFDTDSLTDKQYDESKSKTFFYLYGNDGLHEDVEDMEFYQKVFHFKRKLEHKDVIKTPIFKRDMALEGMNISKKFNYFLQCMESEINFVKMKQLNEYLSDKKSCLVLYTYDSFLIDVHPDDDNDSVLKDIKDILEKGKFKTTLQVGDNYKEMKDISLTGQ